MIPAITHLGAFYIYNDPVSGTFLVNPHGQLPYLATVGNADRVLFGYHREKSLKGLIKVLLSISYQYPDHSARGFTVEAAVMVLIYICRNFPLPGFHCLWQQLLDVTRLRTPKLR